jgi:DNA-binding transcriptional LysR family regulator
MINFNQLRLFYHAAKNLSFTQAARDLFITQPAVTAQMKSLEDHCNLKLFRKRGRRIYLTDEGKTLYECARKIFEYEKEIEDLIEEMRTFKLGLLRLGTTKTYARYFMPFLISNFHEDHPQIKIHLDEGSSLEMIHSLLDFKNELVIIAKVEDDPHVNFIPFSHEEMLLILPPDHPLAKQRSISLNDLTEEPTIMKEKGSGTRKLVNELFAENGLIPNTLLETSNTELIKSLVQRGEGISFVVREAVAAELQEKQLATTSIEGQQIFLDVSIAYLKDQHLSPPAHAFLDILLKLSSKEKPAQGIRGIMADMLAQWK